MAAQKAARKVARNLVTKAMAIVTTTTTTVAVTGTPEIAVVQIITIFVPNVSVSTANTKGRVIAVRRISRVSATNRVGKVTAIVMT